MPRHDDKGLAVPGPLGAAQRTAMLASRCGNMKDPARPFQPKSSNSFISIKSMVSFIWVSTFNTCDLMHPHAPHASPRASCAAMHPHAPPCRQLGLLWDKLEQSKQEVAVLAERLDAELAMMQRLQGELHESRALVGKKVVFMRAWGVRTGQTSNSAIIIMSMCVY